MKSGLLGLSLLMATGCATHYYASQGDVVRIFLKITDAREVSFASSLDHFKLHRLREEERGLWEIALPADRAFRYFYLIDGVVVLPDCRMKETDDFGAQNCIFTPDMLGALPHLRLTSK